ncbi:MAG: hypothetical protein GY895_03045 [Phycisphaera sp.]|nr:hypothetical protein [Phycisphaera sp.]
MQPTECGVVSLAMILASHGRWVQIAELREKANLDGNGLSIAGIARTAKAYGLEPHIYKCEADSLATHRMPLIGWWERRHFLVIEGRGRGGWHVNDPEGGHRLVPDAEFAEKFSGMVIELRTTDEFETGGHPPRLIPTLRRMLGGSRSAFLACVLSSIAIIPLSLAMAGFLTYFVDRVLESPTNEILRPFLLGVGIVVLLRSILTFIEAQTKLRFKAAAGLQIEVSLLEKSLALNDRELTLRMPGDIQQRLTLGRSIASSVVGSLTMLPASVLSALVFGGAVFLISPVVGFGVIAAALGGLAVVKGVNRLLYELNLKSQLALATQRSTMFAGLKSQSWLCESGGLNNFLDEWTSQLASARSLLQRSSRAKLFATSGRSLMSKLVSQVATLVFGGLGVIAGSVTIGELAALQILVGHAESAIGGMIGFAQSIPVLKSTIARIEDIMDCPEATREMNLAVSTSPGPPGLQFEDVRVGEEHLLSGCAAPGTVTAIEGCERHELARLANRFSGRLQTKDEGRIAWRSIDPASDEQPTVRIVFGRFSLFPGTYGENLGNFKPDRSKTKIWSALETVGLSHRFEALPLGLQAPVTHSDGFQSIEDETRLEISTMLIDTPQVVVIAGGMVSLPRGDVLAIYERLADDGAAVVVIEPNAPLPDEAVRLTFDSSKEDER